MTTFKCYLTIFLSFYKENHKKIIIVSEQSHILSFKLGRYGFYSFQISDRTNKQFSNSKCHLESR